MNWEWEIFERLECARPRSHRPGDAVREFACGGCGAAVRGGRSASLVHATLALLFFLCFLPASARAQQAGAPEFPATQAGCSDSPGIAGTCPVNPQQPQGGSQQPPAAGPSQGEAKPGEQKKKAQENQTQSGTSKDRLFFLMPNFLTLENAEHVPPLTPAQKFKLEARSTFDPFQFTYYFILAGYGQAVNSEAGYGQGAQGYGKRFGSIFADSTIENLMVGAALPSLLRQDPRYLQKGKGGFARRTWYALTRIVVTRGDSGRTQFNASEVFGSIISAGISTYTYHPEADRKLSAVGGVWGTQLGLDSFSFMMKEFWPDIRRHLRKKHAGPAGSAQGISD